MVLNEIIFRLQKLNREFEKVGFYIIGVFGSYARGENREDSDLDILYKIDNKFVEKFGGWSAIIEIEKIKSKIEKSLNISKVDLATSDTNNQTLQNAIQKELVFV